MNVFLNVNDENTNGGKMSEDYIKFHLTDLPSDEFSVLLKGNLQKELIEKAAKEIAKTSKRDYGKYKDLAIHLQKNCNGFSKISAESLWDRYISRWKSGKMFIPIDCIIELCKLTNESLDKIEKNIEKIKYKLSPNKSAVGFNFVYDESLAAIGEAVKTEGNIKRGFNQCKISSESIDFINHIKKLLKDVCVPDCSLYENLAIEAEIPNRNVLKIIDDKQKEFRFCIRQNKKKLKVIFHDNFRYEENKEYMIIMKDNKIIYITIHIPLYSIIKRKSSFGICSTTINLDITNKTFCRLINIFCKVPAGKKSNIIEIASILFNSPESVKKAAINVIMASEGWVEPNGKRIRIFVNSKEYIKSLKMLFEHFNIIPTINSRNYLSITSRKDLLLFSHNFDFIINEKNEKLKHILESYKRNPFRHKEGLIRTLKFLKEKNESTAYELSKFINKHKDTAFSHLNNGIRRGLINKNTSFWPYRYSLTSEGDKFLGEKL